MVTSSVGVGAADSVGQGAAGSAGPGAAAYALRDAGKPSVPAIGVEGGAAAAPQRRSGGRWRGVRRLPPWAAAVWSTSVDMFAKDARQLALLRGPAYREGLGAWTTGMVAADVAQSGLRLLTTAMGAQARRLPGPALTVLDMAATQAKRLGKVPAHSMVDNEFLLPDLAADRGARARYAGRLALCNGVATAAVCGWLALALGYRAAWLGIAPVVLGTTAIGGVVAYARAIQDGVWGCYKLHCDGAGAQAEQRAANRYFSANEYLVHSWLAQTGALAFVGLALWLPDASALVDGSVAALAGAAVLAAVPLAYFTAQRARSGRAELAVDGAAHADQRAALLVGPPPATATWLPPEQGVPHSELAKLLAHVRLLRTGAYRRGLVAYAGAQLGNDVAHSGLLLMTTVLSGRSYVLPAIAVTLLESLDKQGRQLAKRVAHGHLDDAFLAPAAADDLAARGREAAGLAGWGLAQAGAQLATLGIAAGFAAGVVPPAALVLGSSALRGVQGFAADVAEGHWGAYRLTCGDRDARAMQRGINRAMTAHELLLFAWAGDACRLAYVGLSLWLVDAEGLATGSLVALAVGTAMAAVPALYFRRISRLTGAARPDEAAPLLEA